MYMFFWFFKQLFYICKRLTKHKFLLLLLFFIIALFLFFKPVHAATPIPQAVINKAKSLCPYENILILQDTNTGEFYVPYPKAIYERTTWYYHGWLYSYRSQGSREGISTPDWWTIGLYVYRNNQFIEQTINNWNATAVIDLTYGGRNLVCVYANYDVIYQGFPNNNPPNNSIYFAKNAVPYITTTSANITKWNFSTLDINGGQCVASNQYGTNYFSLQAVYDNVSYLIDIDNFINNTSGLTFSVPINYLLNGAVLRNGYSVTFSLLYYEQLEGGRQITEYSLGSYTFDFTTEEEEQIQQNMSEQLLGSINNNIQNQTNAINNQTTKIQEQTNAINNQTTKIQEQTNSINEQTNYLQDDTVNNSSIYLPSDNTNDITQDGLNGIFSTIYNAFCTGQAQDIVFPIPFTNKNITLQANYLRNMLQNNNASWVITFVSAFWWYLISRFIVKDITNKITKIKSGNIEDIETSNIKGDML